MGKVTRKKRNQHRKEQVNGRRKMCQSTLFRVFSKSISKGRNQDLSKKVHSSSQKHTRKTPKIPSVQKMHLELHNRTNFHTRGTQFTRRRQTIFQWKELRQISRSTTQLRSTCKILLTGLQLKIIHSSKGTGKERHQGRKSMELLFY